MCSHSSGGSNKLIIGWKYQQTTYNIALGDAKVGSTSSSWNAHWGQVFKQEERS